MAEPSTIEKLDKNFAPMEVAGGQHWYDARAIGVEGRGWSDTESFYDRLPARAKPLVRPPVWELSTHSAGMYVRFVTNATAISARWTLRSANLSMQHMPATGVSGLDLYAKVKGRWIWAGIGLPNAQSNSVVLLPDFAPGKREFLLCLPLYNGVESMAIGVPSNATLAPAPRRTGKRGKGFVIYGTSIVQGGCASRSGMGYPELLARALDCHAVNLGFSGNGPMEAELVRLIAELDPAFYILDCLPNMDQQQVKERTEPAVNILRRARPRTPILLVENIIFPGHVHQKAVDNKNAEFRAAYKRLRAACVKGLHYVPCTKLLGNDNLATVDGIHPTDLGFFRMAKALEPVVKKFM